MATPTIDRRCHWLRRNRRSRRPDLIAFVDTESHQEQTDEYRTWHTLRQGWCALARYTPEQGLRVNTWYHIQDPVDFWHIMSRHAIDTDCLYVVTHNLDYDARVLRAFSILPGIGWKPNYCIMAPSCTFFTFTADKHTIALLDNLNFWRMPLEDLGQEFDLPKLEIDLTSATDEQLSRYCKRDVAILVKVWQYWLDFLDKHDLGNFGITAASQAFNAYRHRFMPDKIGIHNNAKAIELERQSYRGGRCELFYQGSFDREPYYKLDINGLYAYCMQEYPAPAKLVKVLHQVDPEYMRHLLTKYLVIADCVVDTPEPYYALHSRGYNVFPVGAFRVTLTTPEIQYALEHNHLKAIGPTAIYTPAPLFADYIKYLTPLRQQYKAAGDKARSIMCKLLRNSLQGKFGQRGYKQRILGKAPLDKVSVRHWLDLESDLECWDWTYGGVIIRQEKAGEAQDSFPAIPSHICAYARHVLYTYILKAGILNVYYADTDSLIVNEYGYLMLQPYIDPMQLGFLKLEGVTDHLEIRAKKNYTFGKRSVIKGISRKAKQLEEHLWSQVQFTSLRWAFRQGNLDNVLTYDAQIRTQGALTSGIVNKKGRVSPPTMRYTLADAMSTFAPQDPFTWSWWFDVAWTRTLAQPSQPQPFVWWFLPTEPPPEDDALVV